MEKFPRGQWPYHAAMSLKRLALCLLILPCVALAAPAIPGDVTGMWFDARHPGWGLGLVQQNDAVFGTLFTYDEAGMPVWLVASRLQAGGVNFDACGTMSLVGPLYRTQWPAFGSAANPRGSLQVLPAGTISVTVSTAPPGSSGCDRNSASVQYSIDGAQTSVSLSRLTWTSNQARLYGQFAGGLAFLAPASGCADLNASSFLPASGRQLSVNGSADETNASGVRLLWGTGIDTACEIRGAYSQAGQLGSLSGTLSCGPIGSPLGSIGTVRLSSLYLGDSGFVGEVALDINSCHYSGTLSGARR